MKPADFNSYGSRRGNHEVMVRGTFANVRLRNKLVADRRRIHPPLAHAIRKCRSSTLREKYQAEGTPLIILAGKEYGSGSSRDWAAKGPRLLGVRAVIAESYERIHRSNLVGMGILPLQFEAGQNAESLKLTGEEVFEIAGIRDLIEHFRCRTESESARAHSANGKEDGVRRTRPHRYAAGSALLRQRRDSAVCVAAVAGGETQRGDGGGLSRVCAPHGLSRTRGTAGSSPASGALGMTRLICSGDRGPFRLRSEQAV